MNITFQKKDGVPALGIKFFWKMEIKTKTPVAMTDHFIPELFFDYLYVRAGEIRTPERATGEARPLPPQFLKSLFTQPVKFIYETPLIVFGARLSLEFAESFWGAGLQPNSFLPADWVTGTFNDLDAFAATLTDFLAARQMPARPHPMFESALDESDWLIHYSARHKRRLYRHVFGLSRQELLNIGNLHKFLAQTCEFGAQSPRIIKHVTPEAYYDQPHLNHAFKKLTGFSPVEYFEANSILQDNLMSASYNEAETE